MNESLNDFQDLNKGLSIEKLLLWVDLLVFILLVIERRWICGIVISYL